MVQSSLSQKFTVIRDRQKIEWPVNFQAGGGLAVIILGKKRDCLSPGIIVRIRRPGIYSPGNRVKRQGRMDVKIAE